MKDYDLILIPEWVLTEINDAPGRADYVQKLIELGYPIFCIEEGAYTDLTYNEEGNLYQIVRASTNQLGRVKSYLRRYVEKADSLDMDAYNDWIQKLYDEWPDTGEMLSSGRLKKKNVHRPELLTRTSVYFYALRTVRTPRAHIELKTK